MEKENGYSNLIKACYEQIEKNKKELEHGINLTEQREARKNARENGLSEPKFKSVMELKNKNNELYTKVNNAKKILVIQRNRVCRFCHFPLKEPESAKDQIGLKFTNVDFKSPVGYRRLDALFHTECAVAWLSNKVKIPDESLKYVQPRRVGQQTIFSSMDAV